MTTFKYSVDGATTKHNELAKYDYNLNFGTLQQFFCVSLFLFILNVSIQESLIFIQIVMMVTIIYSISILRLNYYNLRTK